MSRLGKERQAVQNVLWLIEKELESERLRVRNYKDLRRL